MIIIINRDTLTNYGKLLRDNIPERVFTFESFNGKKVVMLDRFNTGYAPTNLKAKNIKELLKLNRYYINQILPDSVQLELIEIIKSCSMFEGATPENIIQVKYTKKGNK
tara:strand:- start:939 stop:1265 length:327 start_codon:yes stop_codon:yes gene_type:complete